MSAQNCVNIIFILDYTWHRDVAGTIYSAIAEFKDELERFQNNNEVQVYIHELICDNGVIVHSSDLNSYSVSRAPQRANGPTLFDQIIASLQNLKTQDSGYEWIIYCFAAEPLFSCFHNVSYITLKKFIRFKNAIRIAVPIGKCNQNAPRQFATRPEYILDTTPESLSRGLVLRRCYSYEKTTSEPLKTGVLLRRRNTETLANTASDSSLETIPQNDNIEDLYQQIKNLQQELDSKDERIKSLLLTCDQLSSENKGLKAISDSHELLSAGNDQKYKQLECDNEELTADNLLLTNENAEIKTWNEALEQENLRLTSENGSLESRLNALELELANTNKEHEQLRHEKCQLESRILTLNLESDGSASAVIKSAENAVVSSANSVNQNAYTCVNLIFILDYSGDRGDAGAIYSAIAEFQDELVRFQKKNSVPVYIHELICDNGVTVRSSELESYSPTRAQKMANGPASFGQIIDALEQIEFQESNYEYIVFCFAADELFSTLDDEILAKVQTIDCMKNAVRIAVPMGDFDRTAPLRFASESNYILNTTPEALKRGLVLRRCEDEIWPDAVSVCPVDTKLINENSGDVYRQIQMIQEMLDSRKSRMDALSVENMNLTSSNVALTFENSTLNDLNTDLTRENVELSKTKEDLIRENGELSKAKEDLTRENVELSKSKEDLIRENGELSKAKEDLTRENGELSKAKEDLTYENDVLTNEFELLKKKCESLNDIIAVKESDIMRLERENSGLSTKNSDLNNKCDTLGSLLSEKNADFDASKNMRTHYQCEREKMTQLLSETASLQTLSQESSAKVAAVLPIPELTEYLRSGDVNQLRFDVMKVLGSKEGLLEEALLALKSDYYRYYSESYEYGSSTYFEQLEQYIEAEDKIKNEINKLKELKEELSGLLGGIKKEEDIELDTAFTPEQTTTPTTTNYENILIAVAVASLVAFVFLIIALIQYAYVAIMQ